MIMPFPSGYAEAKVGGSSERILPGGHLCVIRSMRVEYSKADNKMLVMEFDTDKSDPQPQYFLNRYIADNQAGRDPVWRGVYRVVVDERAVDKNGDRYGLSNLKRLNTTICDSNPGFELNDNFYMPDSSVKTNEAKINNERYCEQFKGEKIGIVFREEEYTDQTSGELKVSIKPYYACNYSEVMDQPVPERKRQQPKATGSEQWMQVPEGLGDEGLPFK